MQPAFPASSARGSRPAWHVEFSPNQPFLGLGWTLNYEMLFYLLFAIPVLLSRRTAVLVTSLVLIALVIAGILAPGMPFPWRFWADPIVLEFVFGMSLG